MTTQEQLIADEEAGKASYREIALSFESVTTQFKALLVIARGRSAGGREAETLAIVISHIEAARAELLRFAK